MQQQVTTARRHAAAERAKYETVWKMPEYRVKSHSLKLYTDHPDLFPAGFATALDIGCGLGRLFAHLNETGVDCWAVDIADNCLEPAIAARWGHKFMLSPLWDMDWTDAPALQGAPKMFDLGVCTDVMEHIPPDMVGDVLARIAACCRVVMFKIANFPSRSLGHDLHLTMQGPDWWAMRLAEAGGTVERLNIPADRPDYYFKWTNGAP